MFISLQLGNIGGQSAHGENRVAGRFPCALTRPDRGSDPAGREPRGQERGPAACRLPEKQPWAVSRTATSEASTAPRMSCAECNVTGGLVAVAMTQAHRKRF